MIYQIVGWEKYYENNRTRQLKKLDWVPIPNRMDGDGYTELLDHPNGAAHLGVWLALVQIASRCEPRGILMRDTSKPHDARSLSRISRIPAQIFDEALPRFVQIGWVAVSDAAEILCTIQHDGAGNRDESAASRAREKGIEGNGMEGKDTQRARPPAPSPSPTPPATVERFAEWLEPWPRVGDPDSAARNWLSHVRPDQLEAAFACRDRYLASDEVSRGVVMEPWKFIMQQSGCGWSGRWPMPRGRDAPPGKSFMGDVEGVFTQRVREGRDPW